MNDYITLLKVARDELETIIKYSEMLEETAESDNIKPTLDEIRGDEFNHALIAMLMAANLMNIHIATDDIAPDPNSIEVK